VTGEDSLLTGMVREVLQAGLDVEMVQHLGYEPYEPVGRGSGNSRNGSYPKTVKTDVGPVELRMPRGREGTFEPVTVPSTCGAWRAGRERAQPVREGPDHWGDPGALGRDLRR
jgi:transposase-like protein